MVHKNAESVNIRFAHPRAWDSLPAERGLRRRYNPGGRGFAAPSPMTVVQARTFHSVTSPPVTYGSTLANASTDVPGRRGEEQHPQVHRIGECATQQQLAARHGFARVLDVRAAELRPAFEDVRHVCIEEEKVHVRLTRQTGLRMIVERNRTAAG